MLLVLLKNVFRTLMSSVRQGRLLKKKRVLFTLAGLAVMPVLIITQTLNMFSVWLHIPDLGVDFLLRFVSTSFFGVLFILVLTGVPSVLHHFFLAQDLSLLRTMPIDTKTIFAQKFVEAAVGNLGMYSAVGLPLLISMSLALDAAPVVFIVILCASLLFIVIPTGLAAVLALALVRLFSIKKMRRISTLLLGFFIMLAWAGFQLLRPSRLNPLAAGFEPHAIENFKNSTQFLDRLVAPSDWLVDCVYAAGVGQWISVLIHLALLALLSALLFWVTISWRVKLEGVDIRIDARVKKVSRVTNPNTMWIPFERKSHCEHSRRFGTPFLKKERAPDVEIATGAPLAAVRGNLLPKGRRLKNKRPLQLAARLRDDFEGTRQFGKLRFAFSVLIKDNRITLRDTRLLQSNLFLGAMLILAPFVTGVESGPSPEIIDLFTPYMPITILALLASSAIARQALPLEKMSFVYVLQAPVTGTSIIVSKLLRTILLVTPLTLVAVVVTALKAGTPIAVLMTMLVMHIALILCGALLGQLTSLFAANYNWVDPRYMVNPTSVYLSTFLTLMCGAVGMGILVGGFYLNQQVIAFVIFFGYVSVVLVAGLFVAKRRLSKLEWVY